MAAKRAKKKEEKRSLAEQVQAYLKKPYRIVLEPDDQGVGYAVWVEELPGCISYGDTPEEALEMIREAMELWIETALEDGDPIPEPLATREYSGRFLVRVSPSLHRRLVELAQQEGVSLNALVNQILAQAVGYASAREKIREVVREEFTKVLTTYPWPGMEASGTWHLPQPPKRRRGAKTRPIGA